MRLEKQQAEREGGTANQRESSEGLFSAPLKFKKMLSTATILDPTHYHVLSNRDESKIEASLESKEHSILTDHNKPHKR